MLRRQLGSDWEIVEEGHPSRTTVRDDPIEGWHKNGLKALPICLESHMPLDLVILMLGTNDLKHRFAASPVDISDSIEVLVNAIRRSEAGRGGSEPKVLVVSPPPIQEVDWMGELFLGGASKSRKLATKLKDVARRCDAAFLDAGAMVESSTVDGIHLDDDAHRALGMALAATVTAMFADEPGPKRQPCRVRSD